MRGFRLAGWLLFSLALCGLIYLLAPHQLAVTAYKASLVAGGGVMGYWFSRGAVALRIASVQGFALAALIIYRGLCVAGFALALSLAA